MAVNPRVTQQGVDKCGVVVGVGDFQRRTPGGVPSVHGIAREASKPVAPVVWPSRAAMNMGRAPSVVAFVRVNARVGQQGGDDCDLAICGGDIHG